MRTFGKALEVLWTLTLLPLIRSRDTTLTRHMQKYGYGLLPGQRIATDLTKVDVLQDDLTPKLDNAQKLWAMGVPFDTIDEALNLGIGKVDGGDVGFVPSSVVPVELAIEPPPPPPVMPLQAPPSGGDGQTPPPDNSGDNPPPPPQDAPPSEPPPAKYLLPDGAKEQAKRALKKLIQGVQDEHLRSLREGKEWHLHALDAAELERWLGEYANDVADALKRAVVSVAGDHDAVNAAYNELKGDAYLLSLLEVEAATPFFTGLITHDAYAAFKAMVLQLDPSDDEAEQKARLEVERIFGRDLAKALGDQLGELVPDNATDEQVRAAVHRVEATSGGVRAVLRASLEQSSSLGTTIALDTLQNVGLAFDWQLAHTQAAAWASRYSFDLVQGINRTSQGRLQTAVSDWFREPTTIRDLQNELAPTFGKQRAKLIAQTETTRAAHEGAVAGYEQSGVVAGLQWQTSADERVCPVCGPLQGTNLPMRGGSTPPAHPGCRCWTIPIVDTSK
jgi:SPP1 gp7 family putative phage head morphogenesis protein